MGNQHTRLSFILLARAVLSLKYYVLCNTCQLLWAQPSSPCLNSHCKFLADNIGAEIASASLLRSSPYMCCKGRFRFGWVLEGSSGNRFLQNVFSCVLPYSLPIENEFSISFWMLCVPQKLTTIIPSVHMGSAWLHYGSTNLVCRVRLTDVHHVYRADTCLHLP